MTPRRLRSGETHDGYGFIYAVSASDGQIRYVGQTRWDPEVRLRRHIADARRNTRPTRTKAWIRSVDYQVRCAVLECALVTALDDGERHWIDTLRAAGCTLTNQTSGGSGLTEDTIERISATHKRIVKSPEWRAALAAAKRTPEMRAKQAERNRQRFADPAARQHMAEATRRRFDDPVERQNVAEVNRRRFADAAARQHMSELMKKREPPRGYKLTPEQCERRRRRKLEYWARKKSEQS